MQLARGGGSVASALGLLSATLLGANSACAQESGAININDDTSTDLGKTRIDMSVLYYAEDGGRLKAIEPVASATLNASDGSTFNVRLTSDTLTGATPNGAAPWIAPQTFITPIKTPDSETTTTSASGHSVIVTIPGTGVVASQYTAPANSLPLDYGFKDQRYAIDLGYSKLLAPDLRGSFGGAFSTERDYRSISFYGGVEKELFQKRTTLSASANIEFDQSKPKIGIPVPLSPMSGLLKGPNQNKTVIGGVIGVTEVVNRFWLAQLNYSADLSEGYQTDPYRIISVVDGGSGTPLQYLYESRPRSRFRQSVYAASKIAAGPTVADLSARVYKDDWGVKSFTGEIKERIPFGSAFYFEPRFRYYTQGKADFFKDYLLAGAPLPAFATSDSRLGKFSAKTIGAKIGVRLGGGEFYLKGDRYIQSGDQNPPGTIPGLAGENLFTGVSATSIIVGYSFAFY
ncbi:MAG: DUF3570 domain-containing protein [Parvularculaceae bacterium]